MRRFTRLTYAFSKKIENHAATIALHSMFYNFVRIHQTLKITPAMAAGVTDMLWEISDIVDMMEAWGVKEKRDARPLFEVCQNKIGNDYFVRATLPNAIPEQIYGFATEGEAARWLKNESFHLPGRRPKLIA